MAIDLGTTRINVKYLGGQTLNKIMLGAIEIFPNIAGDWTIYSPFADGSGGSAFEIGLNGTMFQDNTGVIPITASGQPVGMFVGRRNDSPIPLRVNLAAWTQEAARVTATQGMNTPSTVAVPAPDGSTGAIRLVENAANSLKAAAWGTWAVKSGNTYTYSVYAQYVDRQWLQLNISDGAAWAYATFDILNGVTGQQAGSVTGLAIEDVGGGWWRCSMTRTTGGGAGGLGVGLGTDGSVNQSYQGTTGMGALVWGQQVDAGPVALPYQRVQSPNGGWLPADLLILYAPNASNRPLYAVESGVEKIRWDGVNNQFTCDTELPWLEFSLVNGQSFPDGQTSTRTWLNNGQSPNGWQSWYRNTPTATNFINVTGGNAGPTFSTPLEFVAWLRRDSANLRAQINNQPEHTRASVGYAPRTGVGFNIGSGSGTAWYIGDWIGGGALVGKALNQSDIDEYKAWLTPMLTPTPLPVDSWITAGTGSAAGVGFDVFSDDGSGGFTGENTTSGGTRMALSEPTFGFVVGEVIYFEVDVVANSFVAAASVSLGFNTNQRSNVVDIPIGFTGRITGYLTVTNANPTGCSLRVMGGGLGAITVSGASAWRVAAVGITP